jgi:hypothetical protein
VPKPLLRCARVLVAVALVLGFLRDLLEHPSYQVEWGDMLYFHFLWETARTSWIQYGQVPLWNPFQCGGMVELANPHSMALSPFTILSIATDAGTGLRLFIIAHFVIGFLGAWVWARDRGLPDPWAMAPAITFTMGGYFTERAQGHLSFLALAWLPWLMVCLERAEHAPPYAYLAGLVIALCVYEGSPYGAAFMVLFVAMWTMGDFVARTIGARRNGAPVPSRVPLRIAAAVAVAFVAVAALKLFPTLAYFKQFPRLMSVAGDSVDFRQLAEMFLYRPIERARPGYLHAFGEYRNYLGPIVMIGVLATVLRGRALARDVAVVLLTVALLIGDHGALAPYVLLHHLPGFAAQHVPSRLAVLLLPYLGLWFGRALYDLAGAPSIARRPTWRAVLAAVLLVAATADLWTINAAMLRGWYNTPPPEQTAAGAARPSFVQVRYTGPDTRSSYVGAPLANIGYTECVTWEPNPLPIAPSLLLGDVPQVQLIPFNAGSATLRTFSPNRLTVEVDLHRPTTLIVNQNAHPDWRNGDGPTTSHLGRLAVELPAGPRTVELTFLPHGFYAYTSLTLAGLLAAGVAFVRRNT